MYMALYMHEKNGIAKQKQKIIVIIKNSFLIDNRLPLKFWVKIINIVNYL